jgi:hypothetical protein
MPYPIRDHLPPDQLERLRRRWGLTHLGHGQGAEQRPATEPDPELERLMRQPPGYDREPDGA